MEEYDDEGNLVVYLDAFGLPTDKEHAVFKKIYERTGRILFALVDDEED